MPQIIKDLHYLSCKSNDYSVIEKYHEMNDVNEFDKIVLNYWHTASAVKYHEIKWSVIQALLDKVTCDEEYIAFDYNDDANPPGRVANDIVPKLVKDYDSEITCYSVPLFRSILQNNHVSDTTHTLRFTKGIEGSKVKILFTLTSMVAKEGEESVKRYNISLDPTFINFQEK